MSVGVRVGDCLAVMPTLDAESVDAIVTDPPYGLKFMGKSWDHGTPGEPFWREALRVAKPGAHLVAFGGTRTFHRLTCAIEDAGWEIRDCLSWLYGSGFPKSHNGPWGGTALKPAWEPIILARKPLIGTVAANVEAHGTGGLNIDGCRIGTEATSRPNGPIGFHGGGSGGFGGSLAGRWPANVCLDEDTARLLDEQSGDVKGAVSNGRKAVQGIFRDGIGTADQEPSYADSGGASRFFFVSKDIPCERNDRNANAVGSLCASCETSTAQKAARVEISPEQSPLGQVSTDDCIASTQTRNLAPNVAPLESTDTTPTTPNYCESCGCALPVTAESINSASAERAEGVNVQVSGTRFWYSAKASRAERNAGLDEFKEQTIGSLQGGGPQARDPVSQRFTKSARNVHPTVKPLDLMQWLCRLVTPKGGLILDPFCGSGSTGRAAVAEGFRFIGIELSEEYAAIARARIAEYAPLFADGAA